MAKPSRVSRVLRGKTIGFIGAGTMGQALIRGLLARGVRRRALCASDPSEAIRRRVSRLGVRITARNEALARAADIIVLAVKPQEIAGVLTELAPCLRPRAMRSIAGTGPAKSLRDFAGPRQLVISIAAGVTRRALQSQLPGVPVVRVMPNLPATVGSGFSAFALGRHASAAHRSITRAMFEAVGEVVELPERLLDAITAVSGSGPAYLFFLAQAWEEAGVTLGLSRSLAQQAVRQTLAGSLQLLDHGQLSPQEWIDKVTSKRGTTEAALRVLARHRVRQHFVEALHAAARRSKELACSSPTS